MGLFDKYTKAKYNPYSRLALFQRQREREAAEKAAAAETAPSKGTTTSKRTAPWQTRGAPSRGPSTGKELDAEYAKTAIDWWDVRRPEVYFGVKGERSDWQKEQVKKFKEEWGNVRGAAVLNGLIEGTYTPEQVNQYWGAENFASQIKASEYSTGEFSGNPDDFGAYL